MLTRATMDVLNLASGPALHADGTVAAPSIAFSAEPYMGFYRAGGNVTGYGFNGTLCWSWEPTRTVANVRLDIASSLRLNNNVAIDCLNTGGSPLNCFYFDTANVLRVGISSPSSVYYGGGRYLIVDAGGLSGSALSDVNGDVNFRNTINAVQANISNLQVWANASINGDMTCRHGFFNGTGIQIYGDGRYRKIVWDGAWRTEFDNTTGDLTYYNWQGINLVRFTGSGNLAVIGAITAGEIRFRSDGWRLEWNGNNGDFIFMNPAGNHLFRVGGGGVCQSDSDFYSRAGAYKPGGGSWGDSSDIRIKTVLGSYEHGLAEIKQLNPVRYEFKGNYSTLPDTEAAHGRALKKEFVGVIAQEIEVLMPETVTQATGYIDGLQVDDVRILDTSAVTYALINAVKELSVRVESLEARL